MAMAFSFCCPEIVFCPVYTPRGERLQEYRVIFLGGGMSAPYT